MKKQILFLFAALLFAGCSDNAQGPADPAAAGIRGKITSSDGTGMPGASVFTSPATVVTTTDAEGVYSLADIAPGKYTVTACKSGYDTAIAGVTVAAEKFSDGNITIRTAFPCGEGTVVYEGKTYHTVKIGNMCWLKENLNAGARINGNQSQTDNAAVEKYCYEDNESGCDTYGGLYQWNEAMKYGTGPQGICPDGWHIPAMAEMQELYSQVNSNSLKAAGQGSGSGAGNDSTGFSALLSGYRDINELYYYKNYYTYFWSSTEFSGPIANCIILFYYDGDIYPSASYKDYGFSVRCVRN